MVYRIVLLLLVGFCFGATRAAEASVPLVAIHDSELTRALDGMPATNPGTPSGPGTTGFEWWPPNWHYFVMPEALKEMLKSDGTAYEVVSDADISSGKLLDGDGRPRYPIVISLASEAVRDDEIGVFTNYVAAGGTLLVGSSSFTRQTNGSGRGDFAFAGELGLHMTTTNLTNWFRNTSISKTTNHSLVAHLPSGVLSWRMPLSAEDISWGISPVHPNLNTNLMWQVQPSDATVIALGDGHPYLAVKQYGRGQFIYHAGMQPLIAHGGYGPGMYAYGIFRNAIRLAFAGVKAPLPRLSVWPYPYDAALNVRHDFEDYQNMISAVESSARFEFTNGVFGDYFFCTGTLRDEMTNSASVIASLRRAVTNYGTTIGPHNGGFANPNNTNLIVADYDFWHWGPDEALNATPAGFANGKAYAQASISNSFNDIEGWLAGLTNGVRSWVAPYFNATRDASYDLEEQLGIKITGEQKLGPFPHWTLSTQTANKRFAHLTLPVSDWYVDSEIGQSTEAGHNSGTIHALVDYYYGIGALINLYSHSSADGTGTAGPLVQDYIRYSMTKQRLWSTNALGIYEWWLKRGGAQIAPTFSSSSNLSTTILTISGATDPQTAVELVVPQPTFTSLQVLTNGVGASGNAFRTNGQLIRVLAGTAVTNVEIQYLLAPTAQPEIYTTVAGTTLVISAPGVLANDTSGLGTNLTAVLVASPAHGSLTLNSNGSFSYTADSNYLGIDAFTYKANDGISDGNTVTVTLTVANPAGGNLFADDFARPADPGLMTPWIIQNGNWSITGGNLNGGTNASSTYGFSYLNNNWTNYAVEGRVRFPAGAFGGGIGGCVDANTGAHYAAWVYPEGSPGGPRMLRLIKFQSWNGFAYNGTPFVPIQQVPLPSVGTNWHTLKLFFQTNQIAVFYDGNQMISATDIEAQPYRSGGVSVDMWTDAAQYVMGVDDVRVTAPSQSQSLIFNPIAARTYGDSAFTPEVTASSGLPATLRVLSGPAIINGSVVSLTSTGSVTLRASQAGDANTMPAPIVDQTFAINPATLTVSAIDQTKVYGAAVPGLTSSLSGFVNGENSSALSGSAALSTSAQVNSPVGTYPITIAGGSLQASNYVFSFLNGQLSVTKAPLLVTANDAFRIQGQADPSFTASYEGFVNGDDQAVLSGAPVLTTTATAASPPGSYPISISAGSLTAANYDFGVAGGSLRILPTTSIFFDNFTRVTNSAPITPWIIQTGAWSLSAGMLQGGPNAVNNYGFAYATNSWDDYSVEARIRFPVGSFGGGIGGRLDPISGGHYAAWVYPENSPGGSNVLRLIKFQDWNTFSYNGVSSVPMREVNLDSVGTNWHTVKLAFVETNIQVFYDSNLVITASDGETQRYTNGAISVDMWTAFAPYAMNVDEVEMESMFQNQTITFADPGIKTYGDAPFALNASASSGLPVTLTLVSGPATLSGNTLTLFGTGEVTVRGSQAGDAHFYTAPDAQLTFTVSPAAITVSADNPSRSYGAANPTLTGSLLGVKNGENITATYSTAALVTSPVGSYPINAALVDPENRLTNYTVVTNSGTLMVTPAPLTVTAGDQSRLYGSPNPALTGSIIGIRNGDNITASYSTAAIPATPAGSYSITPSLSDPGSKLGNYDVTVNNGTLTIIRAGLTVTANNQVRGYGQTNPTFTVSYGGFVNSENESILTGTLSGSSVDTNSPVGHYAIIVSGQSSPNYTITYLPGTLTVNPAPLLVKANDSSRAYGQTNPAFTVTYDGLVNEESSAVLGGSLSLSTTAVTNTPVGTYPIQAGGLLATNYSITFSNGSLTVTPFGLTVTAGNQTRTYGATNPVLTGTLSGVQNGDNISASYSTTADPAITVGTYDIVPALDDPNGKLANYSVTLNHGLLTVTAAPLSVLAADKTRTYGSPNPILTGAIVGIQNEDNISASYLTTATTNSPVNTYSIVPELNDPSGKLVNYSVSLANGTLTIAPAGLTVMANNQIRLYGQTNPVFSVSYSGFVNGENSGLVTGNLTGSSTADTNSPVGAYPIDVAGQSAPNYVLTYLPGTLSIFPAPLLVQADDKSRAYGQTNPVFSASYAGFVNGETAEVLGGNLALNTPAQTNSPVGSYPIQPTGLVSTNYSITFSNGNLTITAFALSVIADSQARIYGGTNPILTGTINGVQNGDNISATYSTTATSASPVGNYAIIPLLNDPQGKLTNYSLISSNGILTIGPANLSVVAADQVRLYGATNPVLAGAVSGIQNGDNITATYSTTATAATGTGSYSIVPSLVDPGGRLGNYNVGATNGTLTIQPAALIGTANSFSRLYGETNPLFTVSYSGFVNEENSNIVTGTLAGSSPAETNSPVGSYPITVSGQSAPNYMVSYVPGVLTITPTLLLVRADDKGRAYGQTNPVLTASYSGFVNEESSEALGGSLILNTTAETNSPIGTYPISVNGLLATNYSIVFSNGNLLVSAFALSAAANGQTRTYGAANPMLTGIIGGVQNGDNITVSYTTSAEPATPVGVYPIVPSLHDPDSKLTNYSITLSNGTLTINQAALAVTAEDKFRTYGATNPVLTGTMVGVQNGDSLIASYSTTATPSSPRGNYSIVPQLADPDSKLGNYSVSLTNGTLIVNPANLVGTANDQARLYGQTNPTFTVTYSGFVNSENTSLVSGSLVGNTLATTNSPVGTYAIDVSGQSAPNYTVTYLPGILTVQAAPLLVQAQDQARMYGQTNPALTVAYSGFVNGESPTVLGGVPSLQTIATPVSSPGVYPINATSGTLVAGNYSLSFGDAVLRVLPVQSLFFDNFTRATSPGAIQPWVTQSGPWSVVGDILRGGPNGPNNYSFVYVTNTWDNYFVEARIRFPAGAFGGGIGGRLNPVTGAHYAAWIYPENSPGGSNHLSLVKFQDWNTFQYNTINFLPIQQVGLESVGTNWHTLKLAFEGTNILVYYDTNLLISASDLEAQRYTNGAASVDMWTSGTPYVMDVDDFEMEGIPLNQTITFTNPGPKTYGDAPLVLAPTASSGLPVSLTLISGPATLSGNTVTLLGTGSVTVRASQAGNASFKAAPDVQITWAVNRAALTVSASNLSRLYGSTNPILTGTLTGVKNTDNITVSYSTPAVPGSVVGSYAINPALLDPDNRLTNYIAVTNSGTLTVMAAPLAVTAANATRTYGSANPTLTGTMTGVQNGDNITATYFTGATSSSPVGAYNIMIGLTDPQARLSNYILSLTNGTLSITPATLSVTAANKLRAYGSTNPVFDGVMTGIQNIDNITANYTTAATPATAVGVYPIVPSLNDPDSRLGNYNVALNNGNLTINPVGLTGTANNQIRLYGQTNPVFTVTYSGFVNGENAGIVTGTLATGTTADTNSPVGIYPITASGQAAPNYTIAYVPGALTVNPKPLLVHAEDKTRAYGQSNPIFTASYSGFVNGEQNNVLGGALAFGTPAQTNSPVGTYAISASGLLSTNYSIIYSNGVLTVTPYAIAVTADNQARTYGAANPVFTGTLTGVQNADNITATYSTVATTNSPIGSYPIVPALVDPLGKLANYSVTLNNGTLTIGRAMLGVIAEDQSRVYSAPNPSFNWHFNGFANGDTASVVSGSPTLTTLAVSTSPSGNYAISIATGNLNASNYDFTFSNATLTITPAITITHVASSQNPITQGSNLTIVATVATASPATAAPVGNVQFLTNGVAFGSLAPLVSGTASVTTATLAAGAYTVTAQFVGDANFLGSTDTISETVNAAAAPPGPLSIQIHNDRTVTIGFSGTPAAAYVIQAATDLGLPAWSAISTNVAATDGTVSFTDSNAVSYPKRFYRAARP